MAIHARLLAQFGGLPGLRDDGVRESALARPLRLAEYGDPDAFDLAASYAAGIMRNHPFLDGNKLAGYMVAYTFLGANGIEVEAAEEEVVIRTLGLASGEVGEREYAAWLRGSCPKPLR